MAKGSHVSLTLLAARQLINDSATQYTVCINTCPYLLFIPELYKKLDLRGASCPRGITFKKKIFSYMPRKPPNLGPILTLRGVTRETTYLGHTRSSDRPGPFLYQCFGTRDRRGDFFNPSPKFAPTGSRTQDLRRCY